MASQKAAASTTKPNKLKIGTYFVWGSRLWYVCDTHTSITTNQPIALLENCYTNELSWVEIRFFKNKMREVKPINA